MIRNVSSSVHPCDNERTKKNAVTYVPELLHRIHELANARIKISTWCQTMKQTKMTPQPEKNLDRTGQVRTFSFLIENIVPPRIPGAIRSPIKMDRIGA